MIDEKILSIKETTFTFTNGGTRIFGPCEFEGYEIETENQTIRVGITNEQLCCERWGYVASDDDLSDMVGAQLLNLKITDKGLRKAKIANNVYEGGAMFVDFITDRGVFQLAFYNQHNGYYGHEAVVISRNLKHSERL